MTRDKIEKWAVKPIDRYDYYEGDSYSDRITPDDVIELLWPLIEAVQNSYHGNQMKDETCAVCKALTELSEKLDA